jgi:hypothetical protein
MLLGASMTGVCFFSKSVGFDGSDILFTPEKRFRVSVDISALMCFLLSMFVVIVLNWSNNLVPMSKSYTAQNLFQLGELLNLIPVAVLILLGKHPMAQ